MALGLDVSPGGPETMVVSGAPVSTVMWTVLDGGLSLPTPFVVVAVMSCGPSASRWCWAWTSSSRPSAVVVPTGRHRCITVTVFCSAVRAEDGGVLSFVTVLLAGPVMTGAAGWVHPP